MNTNVFKVAAVGMAAAAVITGAALCAPKAAKAATVEACVLRTQETGFCVIPGRPSQSTAAPLTALPEGEPRETAVIRTAELHVEIPRIAGVLPEMVESVRADVCTGEPAGTTSTASFPEGKARYLGTYKITGYDVCVACCGKTDGVTASGTQATVGRTCAAAADLPFGTRIWIDGIGERTVEDRGGGVRGQHIDVLVEDHAAAYAITGYYQVWILED